MRGDAEHVSLLPLPVFLHLVTSIHIDTRLASFLEIIACGAKPCGGFVMGLMNMWLFSWLPPVTSWKETFLQRQSGLTHCYTEIIPSVENILAS